MIEKELSFTPNDNFDPVKIKESERLLRQRKYLYDARIEPISLCNDKVDIRITTRDTWSITPAFNVSHNGDETKTRFSITESNFLGTGKLISVARSSNDQRQEYTFIYRDPNIRGTHITGDLEISENSDGKRHFFAIDKPFYSLDSRQHFGVSFLSETRHDPLYIRHDKLTDIKHDLDHYQIYAGHSQGYSNSQTTRWRYGLGYQKDNLERLNNKVQLKPLTSRTNIYPWFEFNLLENRYTTLTNFHSIKRTEDINLGRNFTARIGYSPKVWSNDSSRLIYSIYSKNAFKFAKELITISGSIHGYYLVKDKKSANIRANINGQFYHFTKPDWVFFLGGNYNMLKNPYLEHQLFLGGDTGMRGYPVRYQMGRRNLIINIEQRFYSDLYWWKLVRVGAAAYIDVGKTWGAQSPLTGDYLADDSWLTNVGFGLRLAPSRADANHVVHVDLAVPLSDKEDIDNVRFMVSVKNSF